MKKKLISTVLCMAMVLGGASTVFAEDGDAAKHLTEKKFPFSGYPTVP